MRRECVDGATTDNGTRARAGFLGDFAAGFFGAALGLAGDFFGAALGFAGDFLAAGFLAAGFLAAGFRLAAAMTTIYVDYDLRPTCARR